MKAVVLRLLVWTVLFTTCGGDEADPTATAESGPRAVDAQEPGTSASPAIEPTTVQTRAAEHCPDPETLEEPGEGATEEAVAALSAHLGADLNVSDVIAGPASDSPYAEIVAADCGMHVVDLSWFVRVCSVPCAEETSASLPIDYFLARSESQWQVYLEY
jgi:hypothetical protein